jgi:acyl-CoA thioesterase
MSSMIDELLGSLVLHETDSGALRGQHVDDGLDRPVVFGGQMLGQAIVGAHRRLPDKRVKSVQTIFARGASTSAPLDLTVDTMHAGRNLASATVTFTQQERLCARALVLLDVNEPDLVRHQPDMPDVDAPDPAVAVAHPLGAPETIIVGNVDVSDPDEVGPPTLQLWVRFPGAPAGDGTIARALLAYATDGWLLGTAMRPHKGIGLAMAHREISTGVVSHALVFHDDFEANDWLLIDHEALVAGGGRSYGRANVFTEDGALVATFTQEAVLRHMPSGQAPSSF